LAPRIVSVNENEIDSCGTHSSDLIKNEAHLICHIAVPTKHVYENLTHLQRQLVIVLQQIIEPIVDGDHSAQQKC